MNMKTVRGMMHSRKLDSFVEYRTALQRDYIFLLEHDPDVVTYRTNQPVIHLGGGRVHTPDFWMEHGDGSNHFVDCVYEVSNAAKHRKLRARLTEYCRERHIEYRIVTNDEMWSDYRILNLKSIFACRKYLADDELKHLVSERLANGSESTVGQLLDAASEAGLAANVISVKTLVWHRVIEMDLRTREISRLTTVRLAQS